MKILHVINSLGNGGAESVLKRLVLNDHLNEHIIIQLISDNFYKKVLEEKNIKVYYISERLNLLFFIKIFKLPFLYIKIKPDVIQTWMYHSNIIGGLFAFCIFKKKIFWNIRHSNFPNKIKLKYKLILSISSFLSHFIPKKIIYCSKVSEKYHTEYGFSKYKSNLIYNGFEDLFFKIDKNFKKNFSIKYKLNNNIIFGCVGRWHDQKDHKNLFKALSILKKFQKEIKFKLILIGKKISLENSELNNLINTYNLKNDIIIVEETNFIQNIYSLFDISILSSSYGEGFSNFLSESMICGIPCISTNVGDAQEIISNLGKISIPSDSNSLYLNIIEFLKIKSNKDTWNYLKNNSRNHILKNYSIDTMINNYSLLWHAK